MTYVQSGMVADRSPRGAADPDGTIGSYIFVDKNGGAFIADPLKGPIPTNRYLFAGTKVNPDGMLAVDPATETAWVPDADSADSVGPLGGECAGDGTATGPLREQPAAFALLRARQVTGLCVRPRAARRPGLLRDPAHLVGADHTLPVLRWRRHVLAHAAGRARRVCSDPKPKGLMVSAFLGGTFGQIQAQPSAAGNTDDSPWIKSGLQGAHVGMTVRYRVHKNFGLFASPELDLQFPTFLWNIDFTFAGMEAAF